MKKILFYILSLVLITSCTDEKDAEFNEGDQATIKLHLKVPTLNTQSINTRSTNVDSEIKKLDILVVSGGGVLEHKKISSADILDTSIENEKEVVLKLTQRADSYIYMYANAQDDGGGDLIPQDPTMAQLDNLIKLGLPTLSLAMGGETGKMTIPKTGNLDIVLHRMVAKVSLNTAKVESAEGLNSPFKLSKFYLLNAPNQGLLTRNGNLSLPSSVEYKNEYVAIVDDANLADSVIYTYEAEEGKTFLIIEGFYNQSITSTFYKIDFVDKNQKYLNITRNHHYKVIIDAIEGSGYSTKEDATQFPSSNIKYHIVDQNANIFDMVTNGQYELGVSDTLRIGAVDPTELETIGEVFLNSISEQLPPESILKPVVIDNSDWFTVTEPVLIEGIDKKNRLYSYTVTAEANDLDVPKRGYITFKAGNLQKKVYVVQDPIDYISKRVIEVDLGDGLSYRNYWDFLEKDVLGVKPDEMRNVIRNKGLHFRCIDNSSGVKNYVYRIKIQSPDVYDSYTIRDNTKLSVAISGEFLEVRLKDPISSDPWVEQLIVKVNRGGKIYEEHYPIYKTGLFHKPNLDYLVGSVISIENKYYYYEVIKAGDNKYWLDRNLGASSNDFYTVATGSSDDFDVKSVGGYFKVRNSDTDQILLNLCPDGFTVPSRAEFEGLEINTQRLQNSSAEVYYKPFIRPSISFVGDVLFPLAGYLETGVSVPKTNIGSYWTRTYAGDTPNFESNTAEEKFWQLQMDILNTDSSFKQLTSDRLVDGTNAKQGNKFKGMLIRCVKK